MDLVTTDFESFYTSDYSLSKMQTDAYILDDRYQTIGVSVKVNDGPTVWYSGSEVETAGWLHANFDWANSAVICQNTLFDGFILTQRYGIRPKLWMDTKSMAMLLYPYLRSFSLANLAKEFKLQDKGTYVANMLGKRLEDISPAEMQEYSEYCKLDTELTYQLAQIFLPRVPPLELKLIDMTIRMFTEPMLIGDARLMHKLYKDEVARKQALIDSSGTDTATLMSADKLAAALVALGVTPPTKVSPKTGKTAYAFAKTDKDFQELLEHEDSNVQALVAARLGVKTTIAETRALTMLETAMRPAALVFDVDKAIPTRQALIALEDRCGAPLPVYLNYWGAKTTGRYSGGNKINWQNLPARGPSAGLRNAIRCPPGHTILVGDSSNIELRVAMAAAGHTEIIEMLANGEDLYCSFASKMFGRVITKADKKERMLGKIAMLSLQYGAGWVKFKEMVRLQSGETLADTSAEEVVKLYRRVHYRIVDMWERFEEVVLPEIYAGCPNLITVDVPGWCIATGEGFGVAGGPGVVYHNLRKEQGTRSNGQTVMQWVYDMGRETVKLYGGKAFENYCQHVARQIVMWQTARINEKYPVKLSVHDEAVCVVRNHLIPDARAYMEECLSMAPAWCRGSIPLACETGVGASYGEAK